MRRNLVEALIYCIDRPLLTTLIAFFAGFLASRIVAADRRAGILLLPMIGLTGFFLSRAVLSFFQLNDILESLHGLRYFIDFTAALFASFAVACLIHFAKPS